jgi:tetratricopeptide (TPR) repeat protein
MRDKRYEEAIALLDKGIKDNPYIFYSEFLKAALYFSTDQLDSAYKYGKLSFYNWPRASNYYRNYVAILGKRKDTSEIKRAFSTYVHYRNEPFSWNTYLMGMLQSKGRGDQQLLQMADSALKLFPADSNLLQRRKEIIGNLVAPNSTAGSVADQLKQANILYQQGAKLFATKSYKAAAVKFAKAAALSPGNYAFYENAGICYYASNQFEKAIGYFNQAIALGTSTTGKSAYFKGVSLFNLGKKEEGCSFVRMADAQKYPDAAVFLRTNCN